MSTAAQVRELDRRTIEELGVPGIALMETAAHGVAVAIRARFAERARAGVAVVCGPGNNGGDGYAVARWLRGWGFPVWVWPLSASSLGDAGVNRAAAARAGVSTSEDLGDAGLIVDAVFGTGLAREVTGRVAEVVAAINAHPAPVVAVDLPTGIHTDTGQVLGCAVRAAYTVTFGRDKLATWLEPGRDLCGEVEVLDIGIGHAPVPAAAEVPEGADLAPLWPGRDRRAHKRDSGHLLVLAGSRAMSGAAVLTCQGALAAGAGLVTLAAPRGARLEALPPEVMVLEAGAGDLFEALHPRQLGRFTAIAAGPGLGGGLGELLPTAASALTALWVESPLPMVFDADAIPCAVGAGHGERVLTPHPGEAGRFLQRAVAEVQADRLGAARALADRAGGVALLKGPVTVIAAEGTRPSLNPTGCEAHDPTHLIAHLVDTVDLRIGSWDLVASAR
ncbi:MAG: NAD(P)H-hydrate epimerase, partial [Deltaproteobacteria bacterium]|nr:NAD(P)H-hydrate epimerase [Deltaproteobacteria bacterium]